MNYFEYSDYKTFILDLVAQMPRKGRGQFRKMSEVLRVNSTVISQIFRGRRHLTPEQALTLSEHFGFNPKQEKYFINLVLKERAGTADLKNYFLNEEKKLAAQAREIKERIIEHKEITDEHKAQFYSEWYYSGIRMLSALPTHNSVDDFADYFGLNRALANQVVEFLLKTGLCVEDNGKIVVGPRATHIGSKSLFVNSHRRNWRMKGLEAINKGSSNDLFYSSPMSLSRKDREAIKTELVGTIAKIVKRIETSKEEELSCLNIDWFQF